MKFKVGDVITGVKGDKNYYSITTHRAIMTVVIVDEDSNSMKVRLDKHENSDIRLEQEFTVDNSDEKFILATPTSIPDNINMTKKIMNVLAVNKKTGTIEKDITVTADNEQHAILKAFGVDSENISIKVTDRGSYEEDKPSKVVIDTTKK